MLDVPAGPDCFYVLEELTYGEIAFNLLSSRPLTPKPDYAQLFGFIYEGYDYPKDFDFLCY